MHNSSGPDLWDWRTHPGVALLKKSVLLLFQFSLIWLTVWGGENDYWFTEHLVMVPEGEFITAEEAWQQREVIGSLEITSSTTETKQRE